MSIKYIYHFEGDLATKKALDSVYRYQKKSALNVLRISAESVVAQRTSEFNAKNALAKLFQTFSGTVSASGATQHRRPLPGHVRWRCLMYGVCEI